MRFVELFAGIGGFSLGFERAGMECVGHVEINPYAQKVLKKHWPNVPLFGDIKDVKGNEFGAVELVCGGWPCQPFSTAGKRRGSKDDRYLWPEMLRFIKSLRPTWIVGENVPGIFSMEIEVVLSDLEAQGYEVEPLEIPACALNAPHRRSRAFIVGYNPECSGCQKNASRLTSIQNKNGQKNRLSFETSSTAPGTNGKGLPESTRTRFRGIQKKAFPSSWREFGGGNATPGSCWIAEPGVGRMADGIPDRVDRIKCLGNAIVPQIAELIGRMIIEADKS